jgi:hypothetical protein
VARVLGLAWTGASFSDTNTKSHRYIRHREGSNT